MLVPAGLVLLALASSAPAEPVEVGLTDAPRSARLLAAAPPQRSATLIPQAEEPSPPPPLVDAPPPAKAAPEERPGPGRSAPREAPPSADLTPPTDRYAGSISPSEVGLGALFVLGADAVAVVTFLGVFIAVVATSGGDELALLGGTVIAVVIAALVDFVLVPFAAAAGAWLVADKHGNNGYGGALLGAWVAQLGAGAVSLAGSLALGLVAGNTAAGSPLGSVLSVLGLVLHYVGVPIGASLGIHLGTNRGVRRAAIPQAQPIVPVAVFGAGARLPTRPHELHAAATPNPSSPFLRLAF